MTDCVLQTSCTKITNRETRNSTVVVPLSTINDNNKWLVKLQSSASMDFLVRFVQIHESFRKPEIEALAVLANVNVEFLHYSETVCLYLLD